MKKHAALFLASAGYVGLIPGIRGTYASIATALVIYLFHRSPLGILPEFHIGILCLITLVGVLVSADVAREMNAEDPSVIVIDEVAGQVLTFLFITINPMNLILGTIFFRVFDIWKPFPIRRLEALRHGVGIMADDLAAGVYANLLLQAVNWMLHRQGYL